MANEYYERLSEMNPGDLADGLAMEAEFDAIALGFGKLPIPHRDGQGFEGPVRVGDAVYADEAVSKGQLDNTLGTANPLAVAAYGDFNAPAWATLPSGTYLLFGAGNQLTNSPFTLAAAKTYYLAVRHAIGSNLYCDAVLLASTDDPAHVDLGREAWRMGPTLAAAAWKAAALKAGCLPPLEALTPAADQLPVFNGPAGAELITLTAFGRQLLAANNDASALELLGAYPVGAPIPWPRSSPPTGFLMMQGQPFNTGAYPLLAAAYPSGYLPDMRGEFMRGWDNGRGVDADRALLSAQADQNKQHTHAPYVSDTFRGGSLTTYTPGDTTIGSMLRRFGDNYLDGAWSPQISGGNESRPRNIAFNYIVRAA